ncbi:MAG: DUF2786 domain-containing protein [Methylophilus sp.]
MTKKEAIDKIKKCLALSASSNEHEAEIALRQAQMLMEKFQIDEKEMLAAGVGEQDVSSSAARQPSNWESMLAGKVADTFGCHIIFKSSGFIDVGRWTFIGCGPAPEIAIYAFQVLHRQLKKQRANHIKTKLKRCKTTTKTRRADLFCEGWVRAVAGKLNRFSGNEEQSAQIDAYLELKYPSLQNLKTRNRNAKPTLSNRDWNDYQAGKALGAGAELNRGVDSSNEQRLIR